MWVGIAVGKGRGNCFVILSVFSSFFSLHYFNAKVKLPPFTVSYAIVNNHEL